MEIVFLPLFLFAEGVFRLASPPLSGGFYGAVLSSPLMAAAYYFLVDLRISLSQGVSKLFGNFSIQVSIGIKKCR